MFYFSINLTDYSDLNLDDETTIILAPLVDRARLSRESMMQDLEMADIINQVKILRKPNFLICF